MKESYYFSHDYNPSSDLKIQCLISEYGVIGYGLYWYIIEQLHQEETHKLPLKQYVFQAIAKQMQASAEQNQVTAEQVENMIKHSILVSELFVSDGEYFFSNRVMRNFEERAKLSEKRSFAGKRGAIAKQMQANAKQILAKSSKGKERKGKEKKINIKEFIQPTWEEFFKYCKDEGFSGIAERAFKGYSSADWHDAGGNQIHNWKQKLQNGWFAEKNRDQQQQSLFQLPPKKEYPESYKSHVVRAFGNDYDFPDDKDTAGWKKLYDERCRR